MIWNIVDRRKRPQRWRKINAIIEPTWHDNSCADADEAEEMPGDDDFSIDQREGVSLAEAITWASDAPCPVTLFIYDEGDGTT